MTYVGMQLSHLISSQSRLKSALHLACDKTKTTKFRNHNSGVLRARDCKWILILMISYYDMTHKAIYIKKKKNSNKSHHFQPACLYALKMKTVITLSTHLHFIKGVKLVWLMSCR